MFRLWSKLGNKMNSRRLAKARMSIAKQLENLEEIGIMLDPSLNIEDFLDFEINEYAERPYIGLLMSMGHVQYNGSDCREFYVANRVWCFDRECIEGHGDYIPILQRISDMVASEMNVTDLEDYVDIEANECSISFSADGVHYRYEMIVHNDWLSIEVFKIFSELLAAKGSGKRFYFSDTGNALLVVLIERKHYNRLNELLNIFIPASLLR